MRTVALLFALTPLVLSARQPAPPDLGDQILVVDPLNSSIMFLASSTVTYKSTEKGLHWSPVEIVPGMPVQQQVYGIYPSPATAGTVFVAGDFGTGNPVLWRSTDGGGTWTTADPPGSPKPTAEPPAQCVACRLPITFAFYGASLYYQVNSTVYVSNDNGVSWLVQSTIPGYQVVVDPSTPKKMYSVGENNVVLYTSGDGGSNWSPASVPSLLPNSAGCGPTVQSGSQVSVNPANPNQVFLVAGGHYPACGTAFATDRWGDYLSVDAGQTFTAQTGVIFSAQDRIYSSAKGEVLLAPSYRSTDYGQNWTRIQQPALPPFAFDPGNSNLVYGSSGTMISTDGGLTWQKRMPVYKPVIAQRSLNLTLEAGTAYNSGYADIMDTDGHKLLSGDFAITGSAPWLSAAVQNYSSGSSYSLRASAKGLVPGPYTGQFQLTSPSLSQAFTIPVTLTVVPYVAPQLRFTASRFAGTGTIGFSGDGGPAASANLQPTNDLCPDAQQRVYLMSMNQVRRVANGIINTYAGTGEFGDTGDGGPATMAHFKGLASIACTDTGLVLADGAAGRIRYTGTDFEGRISPLYSGSNPAIDFNTVLASLPGGPLFMTDGSAAYSWNSGWTNIYQLPAGSTDKIHFLGIASSPPVQRYVADLYPKPLPPGAAAASGANLLLGMSGQIKIKAGQLAPIVIAGVAKIGFAGDHAAATSALINPSTRAVQDSKGNIFFGDGYRVRVILPSGVIETVAGDGDLSNPLPDGADAISGSLGTVVSLALEPTGALLVGTGASVYRLTPPPGASSPRINNGGVVSVASGAPRLCPGDIFSIYGQNFSSGTMNASSVPLANLLNGVQVGVNGQPAPLFYESPLQINAQLPWNTPPGSASVTVTNNGVISASIPVNVVAAAPDILIYNGTHAVAVLQEGSVNGPSNPAPADSYLVIYLVGIGGVDQPVTTGAASPGGPLARAAAPYQATIDGKPYPVDFLGLTPGLVGLAQMNLKVPSGLTPGGHHLILTVGGSASNDVLITTK